LPILIVKSITSSLTMKTIFRIGQNLFLQIHKRQRRRRKARKEKIRRELRTYMQIMIQRIIGTNLKNRHRKCLSRN
jgi:hypothetical protein